MKYVKQLTVILLFSAAGEGLHALIPLPVPASIYGIILLFLALECKLLRLSAIRETGLFFTEILQITFIPATVGLITVWNLFAEQWLAYTVILIVTTFAVMAAAGKVTEWVLRADRRKGDARHE